ncbi:MAG: protein disulfide oxidoreductase [Gammaproteobacteria bacterium]|nr:protein disulfide oxidoreductase [Gammaproteobacteria bacterium]
MTTTGRKAQTTARTPGKRLLGWATQLAVLLLLVLALEAFLTRDALGVVAPPIEAATLEGEPFSLQQFSGESAVVHFWATWCPVCELEQGMVATAAVRLPLITVAMQSGSPTEVRAYLQQQGVAYPVINDEHGQLAARYGVKAVPASFILDGAGRVRFATRGYTTGWGLRIRLWLAGFF